MSGYVGRKEYERLQTKIANILRPNIDPFELKKIIDEDWAADSQGMDKISKQNLFRLLKQRMTWAEVNPKAMTDQKAERAWIKSPMIAL